MNVTSSAAAPEAAWGPAPAGPEAAEAELSGGSPATAAPEGGTTSAGPLGAQAVPGVSATGLDAAEPVGLATLPAAGEGVDGRAAAATPATLAEMARSAVPLPGPARAAGTDAATPLLQAGAAASGAGGADGAAADAAPPARTAAAEVSSPLAPALLTALQAGATLLRRSPWRDDTRRQGARPSWHERGGDDDGNNDGAPLPGAAEAKARWRDAPPRPVPQEVLAAPTPPWAAGLLASLRREAARPQAQAALRRAMEAWRCGRAVLLACPQAGPDPASGWLFVLEPGDDAQQPCLQGQRFAARLSWRAPGEQGRWWAVRVAKVHSVRQGRQLNTLAAAGSGSAAAVDCEIQLGPFPLLQPHWREVLVRVDAVQRLWAALDVAWSLPLLVCDRPLLAGGAGPVGERAS